MTLLWVTTPVTTSASSSSSRRRTHALRYPIAEFERNGVRLHHFD